MTYPTCTPPSSVRIRLAANNATYAPNAEITKDNATKLASKLRGRISPGCIADSRYVTLGYAYRTGIDPSLSISAFLRISINPMTTRARKSLFWPGIFVNRLIIATLRIFISSENRLIKRVLVSSGNVLQTSHYEKHRPTPCERTLSRYSYGTLRAMTIVYAYLLPIPQ